MTEVKEGHGETTLVVEPAGLLDACLHLRDAEGFAFLSDISASDYLGWGQKGVPALQGGGPRTNRTLWLDAHRTKSRTSPNTNCGKCPSRQTNRGTITQG